MKHKKMRGVVAMLLTLVMVVGMLPTSVYAADTDDGGDSVVSTVVEQPADASAWGLSWGVASQGMRLPTVPRAQEASQSIVGML